MLTRLYKNKRFIFMLECKLYIHDERGQLHILECGIFVKLYRR